MKAAARAIVAALRRVSQGRQDPTGSLPPPHSPPKIGLALGGGFARGIAHAGVLRVFEKHQIPIHCITGVSAGSIVAAAYASGATPDEIARAGCAMRFGDVARWSLCRMGFVVSERMKRFLERLLKNYRFEEMRIPLGVLATDLRTGHAVTFRDKGDVFLPIRASCSYPGLFQPVRYEGRLLVDGAMSMEIPALLARQLGATHVISVHLPAGGGSTAPTNVFQVVNRCFQIMQTHTEETWREESDLVITPDVVGMPWDAFGCGPDLIAAGEASAEAAIAKVRSWLAVEDRVRMGSPMLPSPGSAPA
jgi:NTE family protein